VTRDRRHVFTGSPYEKKIGVCRAVRDGRFIAVTGTAPLGTDGKTVGKGDAAAQARRCFEIIEAALKELGSGLSDVIRTRIFLARIQDWQAVAEIHGAGPCSWLVFVSYGLLRARSEHLFHCKMISPVQ